MATGGHFRRRHRKRCLSPTCRTEVVDDADLAARPARIAHPAAVPDQQVWEDVPVAPRNQAHQVALDLDRVVLPREPEPLGQPSHVSVDDDPLRLAALGDDDIRGLARHAGKAQEILEPVGNAAVELQLGVVGAPVVTMPIPDIVQLPKTARITFD